MRLNEVFLGFVLILSHFNLLVFVKCNYINFHYDECKVGPIKNASPLLWISLSADRNSLKVLIKHHLLCNLHCKSWTAFKIWVLCPEVLIKHQPQPTSCQTFQWIYVFIKAQLLLRSSLYIIHLHLLTFSCQFNLMSVSKLTRGRAKAIKNNWFGWKKHFIDFYWSKLMSPLLICHKYT